MNTLRQFYVTLPSSSSLLYYPDNTLSNFTVKLPNAIDFENYKYEVALTELIISAKVHTLSLRERELYIKRSFSKLKNDSNKIDKNNEKLENTIEKEEYIIIPKGYYNNKREVFEAWNLEFRKSLYCKDLQFDLLNNDDVLLKSDYYPIAYNNFKVLLKGELFNRLVLRSKRRKKDAVSEVYYKKITKDLLLSPPRIGFFYSDILQHQIVGDKQLQLLRISELPIDNYNGYCSVTFHDLHYIPISKSYFDTISMSILTVSGDFYPFSDGTLIAKLHFRLSEDQ